jgi:hypothetical protein
MKRLVEKIGEFWCIHVHQSAMWPVKGKYRCSVCLREYAVVFESHEPVTVRPSNVLPIEAGVSVRRRLPVFAISRETTTREPNSIPA